MTNAFYRYYYILHSLVLDQDVRKTFSNITIPVAVGNRNHEGFLHVILAFTGSPEGYLSDHDHIRHKKQEGKKKRKKKKEHKSPTGEK
jgi:hypothetical protein